MRAIKCPNCGVLLEVYIEEGDIKCPRCGKILLIKKLN